MSNDLKRALVKLQNWSRDAAWIIGRLGRLNSDGSYTINVSGKPGWVHVRLGPNGKQGNAIALNRGVPNHPNLRIRMLREHGILVIYGDDISGGGNEQTGGGVGAGVPPHAVRHDRLGPDPLYIRGLAFLPMAARPTSPVSMAVTVERSYYRWNGTTYFLPATDTADLSAYVPGSTTVQHMVIVSVDRSTGTVVVTDGGDAISEGSAAPFGAGAILAVVNTLPLSHWPVAAVRFYNGQTTITAADIFADLRLWGSEASTSSGGGSVSDGLLYSQTVDAVVADTTTETSLLSVGRGTKVLAADALAVGTALRITGGGYVGTTGTPTLDIKATLGGDEVCSTGADTMGSGLTNAGLRFVILITCRTTGASGTVVAHGYVEHDDGTISNMTKTTTTTVDTTGELTVDVTATWGTASASNTITCQEATIELLGVDGLAPVGPTELELQEI